MWPELKTLFWLQWKLTRALFRTRHASDSLRVVMLLSRAIKFALLFPMFVLMGIALAAALILLSPAAAYELCTIVNVLLFGVWLLLPASYSSQVLERFEMARLFPHPIRFRSIVVGSTAVSMLSLTGLWTAPIVLAEIVGLAWHEPLALPVILTGAVPVFALLVLTGRIMEDVFDLVAGDRRLRALALALLTLPFVACWMGQYFIQGMSDNYQQLPAFLQVPALDELAQLGDPETLGEFVAVLGKALEILDVSRFLVWLPPGWATAGMALAVRGEWIRAVLFLAGSLVIVGLLLGAHAWISRRLMDGAALRVGAVRVRRRGSRWRMPGPAALTALLGKDWRYLWRSPVPRRLLLSSVMMAVAISFPLRDFTREARPPEIQRAVPLVAFSFAATMIGMGINMVMTANTFGTFDREGFAVLALSSVDRRYVLLSANLVVLAFAMVQDLVLLVVIAVLTRSWALLPLGLYLGLCLQIGSIPVCSLATILAPYRTRLKFSRGRQSGRLWGMLAWLVSAPPVLAIIVLPYVFWRPGLVLTLPLAGIYSVALYALTLGPLSRLLLRREHAILGAVTAQG